MNGGPSAVQLLNPILHPGKGVDLQKHASQSSIGVLELRVNARRQYWWRHLIGPPAQDGDDDEDEAPPPPPPTDDQLMPSNPMMPSAAGPVPTADDANRCVYKEIRFLTIHCFIGRTSITCKHLPVSLFLIPLFFSNLTLQVLCPQERREGSLRRPFCNVAVAMATVPMGNRFEATP